jgi:hypothetical protein
MKTIGFLLVLGVAVSLVGTSAAEDKKKGPPSVAGKVKAIDAKSITLEGRTKEGKEVSPPQAFTLAKEVKVSEGDATKTVADVKVGAVVSLTLTEDKKIVIAIALPTKGKEKN